MERVSVLLFLCCSLVAAIHATAGDLQTCARNYERVGCFADKSDQSSSMLIYDRYGIQWKNIKAYMHSLACRCEEEARKAKKYAGFAIHFWGECYGKTQAQIDAVNGKTQSLECTGDQKYDGCAADAKECAGHAYTDFVYKLTKASHADEQLKIVCNDSDTTINCSEGSTVVLSKMYYGERTSNVCGSPISEGWEPKCKKMSGRTYLSLRGPCIGKSVCNVNGWRVDENDPCKEVDKYLGVIYKCEKK